MIEYKILMAGDGAVGKTALSLQFCMNIFHDEYEPTLEDWNKCQRTVDDKPCLITVIDISQAEDLSFWNSILQQCDGFLLIYSVVSRSSFNQLTNKKAEILREKNVTTWPMCVVGNKIDLEATREVPRQDGEDYAKHLGVPFFETSAKNAINVEDPFLELVRQIRKSGGDSKQKQAQQKDQKSKCVLQ